jgi:hypothetical protein
LAKGKIVAEIPMEQCNGSVFVRAAQEIIQAVQIDPSVVHGNEQINVNL